MPLLSVTLYDLRRDAMPPKDAPLLPEEEPKDQHRRGDAAGDPIGNMIRKKVMSGEDAFYSWHVS